MALRALVFSSDGNTTSALCHVLTDLGIEAEICSEMLVAVVPGARAADDREIGAWAHDAGHAIAAFYGRFPIERV